MAKQWIKGAIDSEHKGDFSAKAKAAGKSTAQFASEHEHSSGTLGKQARLAKTLLGLPHHKGGRSETSKIKSRYGEG